MYMREKESHDVLFILTVDTEEEWHWDEDFPESDCKVENVQQIPEFQAFCAQRGIRPTYFVDYAVAANPKAVSALNAIQGAHDCEIGAHLHPWCNPPYFGPTDEKKSHVVNLPEEHIAAKLDALIDILHQQFNVKPVSFRTGRWGIDGKVLQLLASRGFTVDSSIYPFYENDFFSCYGAPLAPYWPDMAHPLIRGQQRQIMEIPVTAGFNRTNYNVASNIHRMGEHSFLKHLRTIGLLWHSQLLRKLYLSPELTTAADMCRLVDTTIRRGQRVVHMYLHSSSLIDGVTGLLDQPRSLQVICERIDAVITHLQSQCNVQCCTISEAATLLQARNRRQEELV